MIRQDLYYYKQNKRKVQDIKDKIEYLRAKAEKITPTYSNDKGGFSLEVHSKVEDNAIKILEMEDELKTVDERITRVDKFLGTLKPYQRYIVRSCIIDHVPYHLVARKENTSTRNIAKIIDKTLKENP
jgi:hypothetical protein